MSEPNYFRGFTFDAKNAPGNEDLNIQNTASIYVALIVLATVFSVVVEHSKGSGVYQDNIIDFWDIPY